MKKSAILVAIVLGVAFGCVEKSDPEYDQQTFTSIFDNNQFSASHFPIDVKQTSDGGYLILSERRIQNSNFRGIYLMKTDKFGKYVAGVEAEEQYVNPVGDLMVTGNQFYFFCMDALNLQAQLVAVDPLTATPTFDPVDGGLTYPAAAAADGTRFLLLSYDHEDKRTVMSRVATDGTVADGVAVDIGAGDDVEEPIINHFLRTGKRFPFQVGRASGNQYFFNGFHNYTFSLVFTDFGSINGVVQGQHDDGGFSAVYPLSGNRFAAARFNFGDNYFLPNVTLSTGSATIGVDLGGLTFPELVENARVKILGTTINEQRVLIYASDTKSKQIGLFFYDEANGAFLSSRYLGFSNPFEIASVVQTSDEGLLVCGTTYLGGRFPRICLIKLSAAELKKQVR